MRPSCFCLPLRCLFPEATESRKCLLMKKSQPGERVSLKLPAASYWEWNRGGGATAVESGAV